MAKPKKKGNWFTNKLRAIGEMSALRVNNILDGLRLITGGFSGSYTLNTQRVNYKLARELYHNTAEGYKLGAVFAKPIINTTVGFMGVPEFKMQDPAAQEYIDEFQKSNISNFIKVERNSLRDGDCYVWLTREEEEERALYPEAEKRIKLNMLAPETLTQIITDPMTNRPIRYDFKLSHSWNDDNGNPKQCVVTTQIGENETVQLIDGDLPPGVTSKTIVIQHNWGFVPIVHFANEADELDVFGRSDLEPMEPLMKAYHDVMIHAIEGSKLHSTPRLKLKLNNVAAFLKNNYGIDDLKEYAKTGKPLNFDGKEIFFLGTEEDAGFIEARSATGDATVLLEFLFYCIVDVSETPEFALGVHTPSSLASVKEQMPILIRRIERKRSQFDSGFKRLVRIYMAILAMAENINFESYESEVVWQDIDPRDGKEVAEELLTTVRALAEGIAANIISQEAAVDHLEPLIASMNKWIDKDKEQEQWESQRIIRTQTASNGMEDSQLLSEQQRALLEEIRRAEQSSRRTA